MYFMKWKNCSMLFLGSTILLTSCSKDGTDGKTTLTRTTKEAAGANCKYGGTKFETGIDANNNGTLDDNEVTTTQTKYVCDGAGATYSAWIDVNVTDTLPMLKEERNYRDKQLLPAEALTADIVKNGLVFMYYKNKNGVIFSVNGTTAIQDETVNGVTFGFYPGYIFKEKYLSFLVSTYSSEINDNGSAIRYVLIPGMVQGRSITDLKKMPYSEVAKLYNITD